MGLKRRAVGRKQVLDLTEKQDSPRRSWQTKYQQICVEHGNTKNGDSPGGASSSSATANPLSGLLANYHSDSDEDDEGCRGGDLDSKVSDFLKEIQTIAPSGSTIVVPGQPITTPGIVEEPPPPPANPVSAWQECYDETTGYIYYWHTETNAVTWETPLEYLPQPGATGSIQAADIAVPHHEASPMSLGITSAIHHGGLPLQLQWPHHPGMPVSYPMMAVPPQPVQAPIMCSGARPLVEYNIKSKDRGSSDSEEERIEMITSFGESSDEESEEEIKPPSKKKKPNLEMMGPQLEELIGPKLQSSEDLQVSQPESEQMEEGSSLLSNQVDDVGPPGVEAESRPEEGESRPDEAESRPEEVESTPEEVESRPEVAECRPEEPESRPEGGGENSSSEAESVMDDLPPAPAAGSDGGGGTDSGTDADEVGILSRLRTQARVLRELGGELPAEIRELIEPAPAPVEDASPEPQPVTEPVQEAVASPERPPDLPDFEKEMERMEQELKELTKVSSSVESSPKTTSFALIAGYGDDSDQEDEGEKAPPAVEPVVVVQKRTFESLPTVPVKSLFPIAELVSAAEPKSLFPMAEHVSAAEPKSLFPIAEHVSAPEPKSPPAAKPEEKDLPVSELDPPLSLPSPPQVSHSILFPSVSSSTEVPLPALRLQEPSEVEPDTEQSILPPVEPIIDSNLPKKAGKRKKRLDISTSAELVAANAASKATPVGAVNTATRTLSDCDLREGERKGFGFGKLETDADSFLLDCMNEFESKKVAIPKNKENISFVKGVILNGPQPGEETKEEVTQAVVVEEEKVSEADSRLEEEACRQVGDLAQTIMEKAAFLAEGKEPASPVQVLAIQIETLVSAWHAGALSQSYLSKWLGETCDELGQLETSAAPDGWACQWDRSHKRYYYCNLTSGETQWEYPESFEEMMESETAAPQPQPPEERPQSPQVPTVEDIAGGELAMEICNTPPHSPSPPATPPPPPARLQTPPPPPPPTISEPRELSPPPPPRISPFPPAKSNEPRRQQKGKNKRRRAPPVSIKDKSGSNTLKPSSHAPPPPDLNPPLPPLPPPPSSPPPPPPSDMPPLPPSSPRQQLAYGEPLPPGVDPGEIPYMARPAPPPIYQNPELSPPLPTGDMETYQQHAMQAGYVLATYQSAMAQPGMTANVQGGPVMDYSGVPYMMHTHMSMPAVIAKPPAKKHKAALHAALDSFYSDLAIMEPIPEGVCEAAAVPAPTVPAPAAEDAAETPVEPEPRHADQMTKRKKVKKVVGLGLKKRGVSSLVAKWQQVQQEVRRDFETLDQDNDSCQ